MTILMENTHSHKSELADMASRPDLDIRMVSALAGDRTLNEREKHTLIRLKEERGEGIYSDLLYALTYRSFPSKQAKHLWDEITNHRANLKNALGRDVGISVATHDYLTNVTSLLKGVAMIEESKMSSFASTASKDGLTGLYDQATFKHRLKEEMERQIRYGNPFTLVMFDLDHFKKINDTFGHAEGDIVLKKVADILLAQARKMDTAARYGGEEFAVILPEVEETSAFIFAERLRQAVEENFKHGEFPVTISVGLASCQPGVEETPDNLIRKADAQLYKSKENGRNRVSAQNL
ncbi:MAG: GGDEF domain-containing protein [Magnetococcales bacterium]|nr:GGDEF domain-containing protein [Magnetococcales bacterium]